MRSPNLLHRRRGHDRTNRCADACRGMERCDVVKSTQRDIGHRVLLVRRVSGRGDVSNRRAQEAMANIRRAAGREELGQRKDRPAGQGRSDAPRCLVRKQIDVHGGWQLHQEGAEVGEVLHTCPLRAPCKEIFRVREPVKRISHGLGM